MCIRDRSNAAALNAARQQEQALAQDTAKSQLSANTPLSLGQLDAMTKSSIASGSNATQLATATLNSETQKSIANLNAQTDTYKANLSAGTQTQVANIEANYKTLMQSSVLASQAMQDLSLIHIYYPIRLRRESDLKLQTRTIQISNYLVTS